MTDARGDRAAQGDMRAYTIGEWLGIYLKMLPAILMAVLIVGTLAAAISTGVTVVMTTTVIAAGKALVAAGKADQQSDSNEAKVHSCGVWCTTDNTSAADHGFFDAGVCTCVEDGKVTTTIGHL